jgi:uncharacterized membrane protein YdjX (TVP38/TMEM64 family)
MTDSRRRLLNWKITVPAAAGIIAAVLLIYAYRAPLLEAVKPYYELISDRRQFEALITASGIFAPFVFMLFQILQVVFAPFPGEASGFIGGYVFGAFKGFIYSTIGLSIGSIINFSIGRYFGRRYIRRRIPARQLQRFDTFLKHQGVLIIFFLFVFPGFPKDYLCLFLGIGALPFKVFVIIASIGRMPGTLMLSFQGAYLFDHNYLLLGILAAVSLVVLGLAYRYRNAVYIWVERLNANAPQNDPAIPQVRRKPS